MGQVDLKELMSFRKEGAIVVPIFFALLDGRFILAVYPGRLSEHDLLIKYRQKDKTGKWSRIRTPKHIHWAVDILIKMHSEPEKIREFLDFLIRAWDTTTPIRSAEEKETILNLDSLLHSNAAEIERYQSLSQKGEYSITFLILLARLLMLQEKSNYKDAYMFKNLLSALREGQDLFKIVSIGTHVGRK